MSVRTSHSERVTTVDLEQYINERSTECIRAASDKNSLNLYMNNPLMGKMRASALLDAKSQRRSSLVMKKRIAQTCDNSSSSTSTATSSPSSSYSSSPRHITKTVDTRPTNLYDTYRNSESSVYPEFHDVSYHTYLNKRDPVNPIKKYQTVVRNVWALAFGSYWTPFDDTVILGCAPTGLFGHVNKMYDLGVRGVLNMCEEYAGPESYYKDAGIVQLRLPTPDHDEPSVEFMKAGINFIKSFRKKKQKVYIHCKGGHGRSAAIVLCWLLYTNPKTSPKVNKHFF